LTTPTAHEDLAPAAPGLPADEWVVDNPRLRRFIADVRAALRAVPPTGSTGPSPPEAVAVLRPILGELLGEDDWLPADYAQPAVGGGMGGGIGQWLLYRSKDADLSLFTLVVPAWRSTPVHDHLAWGLVGLYRGEQAETVFRRLDDRQREGLADLEVVERRLLRHGGIYDLLPPEGDIHSVVTTTEEPSVSVHLLANDAGCIWRHAFDPPTRTVRAFRSGYTNRECRDVAEGG
jgi:predicted metal-dependent enzyme (double-stranded beta helix superfamily)